VTSGAPEVIWLSNLLTKEEGYSTTLDIYVFITTINNIDKPVTFATISEESVYRRRTEGQTTIYKTYI
jgi:hypothetical protein